MSVQSVMWVLSHEPCCFHGCFVVWNINLFPLLSLKQCYFCTVFCQVLYKSHGGVPVLRSLCNILENNPKIVLPSHFCNNLQSTSLRQMPGAYNEIEGTLFPIISHVLVSLGLWILRFCRKAEKCELNVTRLSIVDA